MLKVTDTITLAGGATVTIKKLGWKARELAEQVQAQRQLQSLASVGAGIVDLQKAMRAAMDEAGGEQGVRAAVAANPMLRYDKATLLEKGIVSWTLENVRVTPETIAELEPVDADQIANAIHELFRPRTEDEQKNG